MKRANNKNKNRFNADKLAKDLIKKREEKDFSLRDVEAETGVSYATIYNVEAKIGTPKVSHLASLCNWLNVPVQTYF